MEKDYRDHLIEQAGKIIADLQRLQREGRDLLKIFRENPEEYAEAIKTLEWLCGGEENRGG